MKSLLISVFTLGLLVSCATMNKEECLGANWEVRGEVDGASGKAKNYFQQHNKACSEHGVKVRPLAYVKGWKKGVISFCTKKNGFEQGKSGRTNQRVCPGDLQGSFDKGYVYGKQIYDLKSEISELEGKISSLESRISDLKLSNIQAQNFAKQTQQKQAEINSNNLEIFSKENERRMIEKSVNKLRVRLSVIETLQIVKSLVE